MSDADDLQLIPRLVRNKLDRVAIKLRLREWEQLTLAERRRLVELPCESSDQAAAYAAALDAMVSAHTGRPPDRLPQQ